MEKSKIYHLIKAVSTHLRKLEVIYKFVLIFNIYRINGIEA